MDIHPPTGALHSLKDYLTHLSMVVIGILIALSLESAVERHHSHELAQRAVHDMAAEIHANRTQIEQSLVGLERAQEEITQRVQEQKASIDAQRQHQAAPVEHAIESNSVAFPVLSSAAWDSALAMQAVGRIDVDAAEALSRIYSDQHHVDYLQRAFLDVALRFETIAARPSNDTADRMWDRLGALRELQSSLQNLLNGYHELLHLYESSFHAVSAGRDVAGVSSALGHDGRGLI